MKKLLPFILLLLIFPAFRANAQPADSADIYLLTCEPGNASYSVYGHTAIRIAVRGTNFDKVYNWGTFDFTTPNFTYRFAKGKLDYMLGVCNYKTFLQEYYFEGRSVWSQKINLNSEEKEKLIALINENLRPENVSYLYDFFFDNCATRVRDIIENSLSAPITYTEIETRKSFRDLIDEFQKRLPWLDFGADFLLGLQADQKASFRDQMFLPLYLKDNLTTAKINHSDILEPLMGSTELVLDMSGSNTGHNLPWIPTAILYVVFVFVLLITFVLGVPVLGKIADWLFFSVFSLLSVLMIFTNFFSDHQAMHANLLIIAFNPLLPFILVKIFAGKKCHKLCHLALILALLFFPAALIAGQGIHPVTIPVILILMTRLFKHSEFGKTETQSDEKKG